MNAYALGCTDEGLRKELNDMREYGVEIEAMQSYGGTTSLKSKIILGEVSHFFLANLNYLSKHGSSLITVTGYVIVPKIMVMKFIRSKNLFNFV